MAFIILPDSSNKDNYTYHRYRLYDDNKTYPHSYIVDVVFGNPFMESGIFCKTCDSYKCKHCKAIKKYIFNTKNHPLKERLKEEIINKL